jgi:PAS domain S-box-containing protein
MQRADYSVLIIDDNAEDIALLERFLSRNNTLAIRSVQVSHTGLEGIAKFQSEKPDLLIIGDGFPDMTRAQFLGSLSEQVALETLPILCLVHEETPTTMNSIRAYPVGLLKKSMITPDKLAEAIGRILERVELRQERNRAETLFALLSQHCSEGVALTDKSGILISANEAYLTLHNLTPKHIGAFIFLDKNEAEQDALLNRYNQIFQTQPHETAFETAIQNSEGSVRFIESKCLFIEERGERLFMLSISKDVTSRKRFGENGLRMERRRNLRRDSEKQLYLSLVEREKHLQEIQQTAKDSLQTVLTILRFQSRRTEEEKDLYKALADAGRRVHFVMLAHECLDFSNTRLRVEMTKYITSIFRYFNTQPFKRDDITFKFGGDEVLLPLHEAVLCGLILNELLINAFQHAFPNRSGAITVSIARLKHEPDDIITLTVSDTGVGIPTKIEVQSATSIGLMVVNSLTKKLGGFLEVKRQLGSTIRIAFPEKERETSHSEQPPLLSHKI